MSGQQLERSVLERKERDELHAIAEAMALKPGSRTKKADIIDQILRATGVVVDGDSLPGADQSTANAAPDGANGTVSDKPRRTRTARSRTVDGSAAAPGHSNGTEAAEAVVATNGRVADSGAEGLDETKAGSDTPVAERRAADRQRASQARRAAANSGRPASAEAGSPEAGLSSEAGGPSEADRSGEANRSGGSGEVAGSNGTGGSRGAAGSTEQAGRGGSGAPASRDRESSASESGSVAPSAPASDQADGRSGSGQAETSQRSTNDRSPGQGNQGQGNQGQGNQGQGNQGQGNQNGQASQGAWGADGGDGANRRGRRRRGRDRGSPQGSGQGQGPERGDRDLQTGAGEGSYSGEPVAVTGLLDLSDKGYGFLRTKGFLPNPADAYVSVSQVRRFGLRKGDEVEGTSRPPSQSEAYPALVHVNSVGGMSPEEARLRPRFEDLTPLFPDARLKLEVPGDSANMTARIVDLLSPIGKGQRGLIVSPPKAGKTTVLKQIAHSIEANNPDVHLMVLLVDERPEEVTDMRRSVKGEVIASTFDRPADEHTAVAELTIERAKRLVEAGRDVVIVLDGITRLARAYNLAAPTTGRIMSGGVDSGALYPPKKFFGSARNIEEGGSLTILATALVETGSRMDEVIFEEFKGTGNMELRLDRRLAERRIYPAIEVNASSTRHEELLFDRSQLAQVWKLRRVLNALASDGTAAAGLELLMDKIRTTKSNDEFLAEIAKGPTPGM